MSDSGSTRTERDSLGPIEVPNDAYYGAQTERARRNFPVSGLRFPRRFLAAMGMIKAEAAAVNAERGVISEQQARRDPPGSRRGARRPASMTTFRSTSSRRAPAPRPT